MTTFLHFTSSSHETNLLESSPTDRLNDKVELFCQALDQTSLDTIPEKAYRRQRQLMVDSWFDKKIYDANDVGVIFKESVAIKSTDLKPRLTSSDRTFSSGDSVGTTTSNPSNEARVRCSEKTNKEIKPTKQDLRLESNPSSKPRQEHNRGVSFGTVQVRYYEIILSDHPDCLWGPSIGIGWRYVEGGCFHLKYWEGQKVCARTPLELLATKEQREDRLRHVGVLKKDIAKMAKVTQRARRQRLQTMKSSRYGGFDKLVENLGRNLRSVVAPTSHRNRQSR